MPSPAASKDRPNSLWPVGSHFDLLNAWLHNPIEVKRVNVATNDLHVVAEDERGVRYYAHTDRIASEPRFLKTKAIPLKDSFDDLLGLDVAPTVNDFEELI